MENKTELARLEEFVDKLLTRYGKLQELYGALETRLEERDAECARLKEQIAELRTERSQVGNKVAGLIDRIEQWEAESGDIAGEDAEGVQGKLFLKESPPAAGREN
jgi:phage shock protein A